LVAQIDRQSGASFWHPILTLFDRAKAGPEKTTVRQAIRPLFRACKKNRIIVIIENTA
jgi:hypothetical protein